MASSKTSPEFDTIVECTSLLVKSIKDNIHAVGTELYNAKLLSDTEYTTLISIGSPSSESFIKAVRTVTAVRNKIERNPLLYDVFVSVLTKQGVTLNDCVDEIARNYHVKLTPTIPQIQVTHLTQFVCPYCQKCTVQKFLPTGCTTPCKKGGDTLQFMSLKTSGCIVKDKLRKGNLKSEFEEITFLFGELRRLLIKSATNSVQELKILLLTKKVDLMNCNSIDGIICKRTSFFNYDFLEMIITEFGSNNGRQHLRKYLDKFDTYCTRNVNEVPFTALHSRSTGSNTVYLALQYTHHRNAAVSLKQIKSVCLQLANKLNVEPWDLQLVSIQEDCVLILSLAKSIAAEVFPVSTATLDTLHLSVPYRDLQTKLFRGDPKQDSSKVFLHPSPQVSSVMSEKCEDRTRTENGFNSVDTSLEEDDLISSLSLEAGNGLSPIVEENSGNGAMSVDTKSRRSKQRTAFKKKADRQVAGDSDWCPSCLRCDYCDRTLPPGQHSIIHQEKPYCNGCYQLLFGQEGFRNGGVHVTSKIGPDAVNKQPAPETNKLLSKIAEYNMYKQNTAEELQSKQVNGQLFFEGVLKIYWGLKKSIRLAPGIMYAKARNNRDSFHDFVSSSNGAELNDGERKKLLQLVNGWDNAGSKRDSTYDFVGMDDTAYTVMLEEAQKVREKRNRRELMYSMEPSAEDHDRDRGSTISRSSLTCSLDVNWNSTRKRSASFRRLSRRKKTEIRMETRHHRYTPPHGQSTNLRVSNAIQTVDVLKMLLAKFKVENDVSQFSLCVFYDNGRKELCKDDDYPLKLRLKLGPSEDIAKLFVIETSEVEEILSAEASQWIKFTVHELDTFCTKFTEEEEKEEKRIRSRFGRWRGEVKDALNSSQTDT